MAGNSNCPLYNNHDNLNSLLCHGCGWQQSPKHQISRPRGPMEKAPDSSPGGVKSILNSWELSHCDKRGENFRSKSVKKFLAVGAIGHK